jgi:hypothetical protein
MNSIRNINFAGKKALVRVDFNVPVDNGLFFVSCCIMPDSVCDGVGYVPHGFRKLSNKSFTLDDFDQSCSR